jgi:hypothetical protein
MSRYVLKEAQDISGAYYLVEMVPSLENQLTQFVGSAAVDCLSVFDLHETVIHTSSGSSPSTHGFSVLQVTLHHIICKCLQP